MTLLATIEMPTITSGNMPTFTFKTNDCLKKSTSKKKQTGKESKRIYTSTLTHTYTHSYPYSMKNYSIKYEFSKRSF